MKALDPNIREAAQRVTAWHIARLQAHLEPQEPTMPPPTNPGPDVMPPVVDPSAPQPTHPLDEPQPAGLVS